MNQLELTNMDVKALSKKDATDIQGGFLFLFLLADALVLGTIAAAGAAVYARFQAGVNDACKC